MRDIDIDKISEGIDYELIPAAVDNEQAWDVRFLRGDYVETVIRYGNVAFDGKEKCLKFNFKIITSPDQELTTTRLPLDVDVDGNPLRSRCEVRSRKSSRRPS